MSDYAINGGGGAGEGAASASGSGLPSETEKGEGKMPAPSIGRNTPFGVNETNRQASGLQAYRAAMAQEEDKGLSKVELGMNAGQGYEEFNQMEATAYKHPEPVEAKPEGDTRKGTISKPATKSPYPGGGW